MSTICSATRRTLCNTTSSAPRDGFLWHTGESPSSDCYRWERPCCSGASSWELGPIEYADSRDLWFALWDRVWSIGFTPGRRQIHSVLRNKRRTFAYTWGVVSWLVIIGLWTCDTLCCCTYILDVTAMYMAHASLPCFLPPVDGWATALGTGISCLSRPRKFPLAFSSHYLTTTKGPFLDEARFSVLLGWGVRHT
jgi:hypothetical protein